MSKNLATWEALCRPPASALKKIKGGRLGGMTDINPQWRLKMMTEQFGPIGIGWYYEMLDRWTEQGAPLPTVKPSELGEFMCFVSINLYVKDGDEWSKPIFGLGGSKLFEKEKDHFYNNDEGYKMALTDALSVAMKELGMAADIYQGLWDGSKYRDATPVKPEDNAQSQAIADWQEKCGPACTTVDGAKKWWEDNKEQIKSDCGSVGAADSVYPMWATYYERLKQEAAE